MIKQSPESDMPEPFRTYVQQRSDSIAECLEDIVDCDVQLCPRAILDEERIFDDDALVYGVVVDKLREGYKSVLYPETDEFGQGIATNFVFSAYQFAEEQFNKGNRVRVKDPLESDGKGQLTVATLDELGEVFANREDQTKELVIMPHLQEIHDRISIGYLGIRGAGGFDYIGRETAIDYQGETVYGGTLLALHPRNNVACREEAQRRLEIAPELVQLGRVAVNKYMRAHFPFHSRVSVDVIRGKTDSGGIFEGVVDITPRVSGATPAEVLAVRELAGVEHGIAIASSRLLYDPDESPKTGKNFVDTNTLVINGKVHEVLG